jgi:molecular chaperone DnaK
MRRLIGIDLGTTNSAAAFLEGGEPVLIPNDRGSRITPSVVAFNEAGDILVGESAKNQAVINAERTILAVKRSMGEPRLFTIGKRNYSPEEISSFILRKLKKDAESYLGEEVREAVVTVPAHFSEFQRRATVEAGKIAGLKIRRVLNEPTAAALSYAYRSQGLKKILVYDLGGGTFDVTCLLKQGKNFTVKSTAGNNNLGGLDFDNRLLKKVLDKFEYDSGLELRSDKVVVQQLREQVENAKIELSSRDTAVIALPFITGTRKPVHLHYPVHRKEFEELIRDLIEETITLTRRSLRDAGFEAHEIGTLILSGGSSRIPLVQNRLLQEFRLRFEKKVNPDEVVALGAAVQAGMLEGPCEDIVLRDVSSYTLGVEIDGNKFIELIPRNSPIPVESKKLFTTVADHQTSVEIHVLQGESRKAADNISLGRFLLSGIRDGRQGVPRIEVRFALDADGIVTVRAHDIDTFAEQRITVTPAYCAEKKAGPPEAEGLKIKVNSLLDRVVKTADTYSEYIERDFRREIDDIFKSAKAAVLKADIKEMKRSRTALEIIIGELNECVPERGVRV